MKIQNRALVACLAVAAAALAAQPLSAQSAQEVLETALDRYEERMEGIQDYTLTQNVMGQTRTTHFERATVQGRTVFRPAGQDDLSWGNPQVALQRMSEKATLRGTEAVDGEDCHVVVFEDLTREDFEEMSPEALEEDPQWTPDRMTLYLDTDESIVRRMKIEGSADMQGEQRPVVMTMHMKDYREVEGMVHPFRMEMNIKGMPGTGGEDQARMQEQMEQMKEQMEKMPPEMRKRIEKQVQQMQQMMGGDEGMNVTVEVTDLKVNQGAPSGRR